jgi:hypothetical protein
VIRTDRVDSIKLVPVATVNYVFGANKIFVIKQDTIEAREVKLGDRFGSDVEIAEGVAEGETVATTQVARLDSGVKVTVAN